MNTKPLKPQTLITLLIALCALISPISIVQAQSQTGLSQSNKVKVGADLKKKIGASQALADINVIIQPNGLWSKALTSDLSAKGAVAKPAWQNVASRAVKIKARDVDAIASRSDVAYMSLDREVKLLGHVSLTTGADAAKAMGGTTKYDGTGIGIAVFDSGIDPNHISLDNDINATRIVKSVDFTGENRTDDPYGHGTHVAAVAAGNGMVSQGAYLGIAPNAKIINLRVLNSQGKGTISGLLAAIDWLKTNRTTYNIRVVNMSLGAAAVDSYTNDPLCLAVRGLVDAGIVVVAASGNEGKDTNGGKVYGRVHTPGIEPSVITVGSTNTFGTDTRDDDAITSYSSRGPTRGFWTDAAGVKHYDNLVKPDLVAPGNRVLAAQAPSNYLVTNYPSLDADITNSPTREQMYLSGTSMSTPVVAGAVAMLLQANPSLTPNLVKTILMYSAQQLNGFNTFEQGAGQINIEGAMRIAKLVRTDLTANTALGAPLLTAAAPVPSTTIDGFTFGWGQGVVLDYTFATGINLITKYQKIYALGSLMSDGTLMSDGVIMSDGTLMSDGVIMSDSILISNGVIMSDGIPFLACGSLMSDGTLMSDGVIMGDGTLMSDGVIMGDGTLMSDFTAMSLDAMINGDYSNSMAAVREVPPVAPKTLTAQAASGSQINLSWTDASSNETGFTVERSTDGITFTTIATLGADVVSYSNTGLTATTTYKYRVSSFITNIGATASVVATATTLSAPPAAPTTLAAPSVTASQVNLTWVDASTNETGFKIERCTGSTCTNFVEVAQTAANVKAFSSTGLARSTTYRFRILSFNAAGNSAYSAIVAKATAR